MSENKRFQIIHLGNPYDFVVKDHQTNKTYGTLQGDDKSLQECLDNIVEENEQLKQELGEVIEICRKYGIYKEELKTVLYDYDKILKDNGERAIRYKYCVNGCCE